MRTRPQLSPQQHLLLGADRKVDILSLYIYDTFVGRESNGYCYSCGLYLAI